MATSAANLDVRVTETRRATVLHLDGYVDVSTRDVFTRVANAALACGADSVVVDCAGLTYLDSALINATIALRKNSDTRMVAIENLSPLGHRVFSLCDVPVWG